MQKPHGSATVYAHTQTKTTHPNTDTLARSRSHSHTGSNINVKPIPLHSRPVTSEMQGEEDQRQTRLIRLVSFHYFTTNAANNVYELDKIKTNFQILTTVETTLIWSHLSAHIWFTSFNVKSVSVTQLPG